MRRGIPHIQITEMSSIDDIKAEALKASEVLLAKRIGKAQDKIPQHLCQFSPDPAEIPNKIWAPSQAVSKFQMEQALGDWAEERVTEAINKSESYKAIAFGDNDKTLSQDESFSEKYRSAKTREYIFGKRSDLLLFKSESNPPAIAYNLTGEESELLCTTCEAAIEVRSSRTSAQVFIENCEKMKNSGKRPARMEPSYTVKIEDLSKVYRWISRNQKPIIYTQVFFDSIYALNFIEVFRYINSKGDKLKIENPERSGKFTIMIPVSVGKQIGIVTPPDFEAVHTLHDNGRHDVYAKPVRGNAEIDLGALLSTFQK